MLLLELLVNSMLCQSGSMLLANSFLLLLQAHILLPKLLQLRALRNHQLGSCPVDLCGGIILWWHHGILLPSTCSHPLLHWCYPCSILLQTRNASSLLLPP